MGFRYNKRAIPKLTKVRAPWDSRPRKSMSNGIFRATVSKSGISFSYGFPGFRKTFLANGREQYTRNFSGTGISYVTTKQGTSSTRRRKRSSADEALDRSYNRLLAKCRDIPTVKKSWTSDPVFVGGWIAFSVMSALVIASMLNLGN